MNMQSLRWLEPFKYTSGQAFRLMPLGTFRRGERTLDLTAERLREMAENYKQNRPRWRIPIYFGHPSGESDPPKAGNVTALEFRDGDGLYALPEYTDDGAQAVADGKYQFVSPGILWSLNGSAYTDEQGHQFDNILDHIALTNKPFFGRDVALFSAGTEVMMEHGDTSYSAHRLLDAVQIVSDMGDGLKDVEGVGDELATAKGALKAALSKILALFEAGGGGGEADNYREFTTEQREALAKKGAALPDGSFPIESESDLKNAIKAFGRAGNKAAAKAHIIKRARALGKTDLLPEDWQGSTKEKDKMTEDTLQDKAEGFAVTADEFAALKAKADKVDALEAQSAAARQRADEFAAQLAAERKARRMEALRARCEQFQALPEKAETLAEKLGALEEKDTDLFGYFDKLLGALDATLAQTQLFSQVTGRPGTTADTFEAAVEAVLKEQFAGDRAKYAEAMHAAAAKRPDLARAYYLQAQ